jgi:hypothetical protein
MKTFLPTKRKKGKAEGGFVTKFPTSILAVKSKFARRPNMKIKFTPKFG